MKNKGTLKWLYQRGKSVLLPLIIFAGGEAFLSVVTVWFALVSRKVIDTATGQVEGSLQQSFLVLVGFLLLELVLHVFLTILETHISGRLEIKIKDHLFRSLLQKQWHKVGNYHTGELMNRLTSDIRIIVTGITTIIPSALSMLVKLCSSFVVLYMLAPTLAVCIVSLGPLIFIFGRIYSRKMKQMHKDCQQSDGLTRSYMQEILQNLLAVKAFGNENSVALAAMDYQKNNFRLKLKRSYFSLFASVCLFLVFTAGYYVTLGWGAYCLSIGTLTYGTLTAMLQLVGQLQAPFKNFSSLLSNAFTTLASAERIMELEAIEEEPALPCPLEEGEFEEIFVDHLSFSYPGLPIYTDAVLTLKKGEFLAIAGESGIGKSTLLKLLLAMMQPDGGHLFLKGAGKQAEVSKASRRFFSYVPQGNMILSGTIRENIAFHREGIAEEKILRCASIAQMDSFLAELPDGIETRLKEGGEGLSEGQIQRIAIARALISDAPILLLDEATSALDETTEYNVLKQLKELTDKTCIIVSHKNAAFSICDKLATVSDGKLSLKERNL